MSRESLIVHFNIDFIYNAKTFDFDDFRKMAVLGMSAHDLCRMVMLVLGLIMVFLNFVLSAAALAKINSTKGTLKDHVHS